MFFMLVLAQDCLNLAKFEIFANVLWWRPEGAFTIATKMKLPG